MKLIELNRWLAPGGAERFIVDLSNELADRGNEVYVCTYMDERNPNDSFYKSQLNENVLTINIQSKGSLLSKIKLIFSVYRLINKLKPDVVHCHLNAFNFVLLPSLFLRRTMYVNTLHNVAEQNIKQGFDKWIKGMFYKKLIKPVTISPICYQSFTSYMSFNTSVMIDNGCRLIDKTPLYNEVCKEIDSYKRTVATKVFINVARVHPQKNHKLLIESFNKFIGMGYDAILLVIGSLDSYSDLTKSVLELNCTDRVYFLGTKPNVPDYLYNSDAFCLSSLWEGAPISLLEAGFAGCYPLCTPVGGCVDAIVDERWGLLSQDTSVDAYLSMLVKFMSTINPNKQEVSELYKSKYTMRQCAAKYQKLFLDQK